MQDEGSESTKSGVMAFFAQYGDCTPATVAKFLGISEKQFVNQYWQNWKKSNETKIN